MQKHSKMHVPTKTIKPKTANKTFQAPKTANYRDGTPASTSQQKAKQPHMPQTIKNTLNFQEIRFAGMRDNLIHSYFGIDTETIYKAAKQEIPKLKNPNTKNTETTRIAGEVLFNKIKPSLRASARGLENQYSVKLPRKVITIDYDKDAGDLYIRFKNADTT